MIEPGIEPIMDRIHAWTLDNVENRQNSLIYDRWQTVEKAEVFPDPEQLEEAAEFFPGLVMVYQDWTFIEDEESMMMDEVHGEHNIEFALFRALGDGEKPGLHIRHEANRVAKLFLHPKKQPPRDPDAPNDTSLWLWRPEDVQQHGLQFYELFCRRVVLSDPLELSQDLLIEQARIQLIARGHSREL